MAIGTPGTEVADDDDYDEEADSDFDDRVADEVSVSSDDEQTRREVGKNSAQEQPQIEELDSGDEATIKERKKSRRKKKRNQDGAQLSSEEEESEQWRAKTRSMRAHDNIEKRKKVVADIRTSTVDVDKLWEEMNRPGPLPPVRIEGQISDLDTSNKEETKSKEGGAKAVPPPIVNEETVTIKRQFQFAGETHIEEKVVPKSSAEAQLWLSQQEAGNKSLDTRNISTQRPLRKISKFDPNYSNLDAFRNDAIKAQLNAVKGPKLNVVEKSKMDWAAHVDAEGLKEELDKHSKAKDAYLNRMDFLGQVGQRKEDEAKLARQKG